MVENNFSIPDLPYVKLRFFLKPEGDCTLPAFKGSLLRGAFGNALRKTVCVMNPRDPCQECFLNRQCVNTRIFETLIFETPPRFLKGLNTSPRPFVLYCADDQKEFPTTRFLEFEMTLIGNAIEHYPFVIFAVHKMAERGLGYKRYKFYLQKVIYQTENDEWKQLYDGTTRKLISDPQLLHIDNHQLTSFNHTHQSVEKLAIRFITPARMKFNRELGIDFTFRQLLFKMLRRILELTYFYVPGTDISWEFSELLTAADNVEIVDKHLQWVDLTRYSSRHLRVFQP